MPYDKKFLTRTTAWSTLLLAVPVLAACAGPTAAAVAARTPTPPVSSGPVGPVTPPTFVPDQATWSLPLDDYRPDVRRLENATGTAYAACMSAHGYPTPAVDPAATIPTTRNRVLYSLFDVSIAQRFGYHAGPAPDPSASSTPAAVPTSPAGSGQATACSATATRTLALDGDAMAQVQNLALTARSQAQSAPAVVAAATRWAACMAPLAVPDLPTDPVEMPSDSQRARFHAEDISTDDSALTRPSADEIARAVTDARCRDVSGYSAGLYSAETAAQQQLMVTYPARLTQALTAAQSTDRAIAVVLGTPGK